MGIDIERLKTDAAYWDEVAPEGAEIFCPETDRHLATWWKGATWSEDRSYGTGLCILAGKNGDKWKREEIDRREVQVSFPRPTKPAAQEWDGSSAPAPGELAVTSGGKCQVLGWDAKRDEVAVQWHDGEMGVIRLAALKPTRTAEQRQRDGLLRVLMEYPITDDAVDEVADAVMKFYKERYNLEPKDA